jgi:tetratricopeptide (TPR) repeat protein
VTEKDDIRRSALEERIRLAQQDIEDLQRQVDDGELDEDTAADLEARYRSDLESAEDALKGMPQAKKPSRPAAKQQPAPASSDSWWTTPRIMAVAAGAMVLLTVVIVVLATSGGDEEPGAEGVLTSVDGTPQPGTGGVAELEAAVAAQPENNAMRLALAGIYFESGDFMNAMNHYSSITGNDPTPADAAIANARIGWMAWAALNDPATALSFLDAAIGLDPAYGEAVLWKGIVLLYGMEDGDAAIPLFERVLELPDLPPELRPDVENMLDEARGGGA